MRNRFLAFTFFILAACNTTGSPQVSSADLTGSFATDLNTFRTTAGRAPVQVNGQLRLAAQRHAEDMQRRGYFSHQSPGGPHGDDMSERITTAGCGAGARAENIAQGQRSEAAVFAAWRASPGHRRNMLGANYTQYGLGRSGDTWVLVFSNGC
mgnify:CR=1 FL=1